MRRYFGTDDLSAFSTAALAARVEHMRVDLGLETIDPDGSHPGPCCSRGVPSSM